MRHDVIQCSKVPKPVMGSHAVRAGDLIFMGGQIPTDYKNGLAPEVKKKSRGITNPTVLAKIQSDCILKNTQAILKTAGSSLDHGVRIDQLITEREAASPYLDTRKNYVSPSIRPASTNVAVEEFLVPGSLVGLECIAVAEKGRISKEIVDMGSIPKSPGGFFAGGPQGVMAGDFVFLTGQIASDFKTGVASEARRNPDFWYGSPIKLQTDYVLKRLQMVLEEAGSSLENVVKADVWLLNMEDYYEFEEVWREFFPKEPPARTIIPVSGISDVDCCVEINMIAVKDDGDSRKETITAKGVPITEGHQPHAVRAGNFLFLSGLLASDGKMEISSEAMVHPEMPWFGSSGEQETEHILQNMEAICRTGNSSLKDVVWTQNFYTDLSLFNASLEVWQAAFPKKPPAALACGVRSPHWIRGCSIQMDAVAIVSK